MASPPNIAERGMAVGLRALNRVASSGTIDRLGLRDPVTSLIHGASKTGARTAATAGRTFAAAQRLSRPARQPRARTADLFDLTPSDEQILLRDAVREFGAERLRPAALDADTACAAPPELLTQANALGLTIIGAPESWVAPWSSARPPPRCESLAHGDMGAALPGPCRGPDRYQPVGDAQQATFRPRSSVTTSRRPRWR
jgi:hypothetical protein